MYTLLIWPPLRFEETVASGEVAMITFSHREPKIVPTFSRSCVILVLHSHVRIMCYIVLAYKRTLRTLLLIVLMPIDNYGTDRYVILLKMHSNSR